MGFRYIDDGFCCMDEGFRYMDGWMCVMYEIEWCWEVCVCVVCGVLERG